MTVKANMPTLYKQLKKLPWPRSRRLLRGTDHGRRARHHQGGARAGGDRVRRRRPGAQLRRTVTQNGKKTVEVVYLITSDKDADPATLAASGPEPLEDMKIVCTG